jgi:hypothetical protein
MSEDVKNRVSDADGGYLDFTDLLELNKEIDQAYISPFID